MRACGRADSCGRIRRCAAARLTRGIPRATSGVELRTAAGVLLQDFTRRKADAITLGQAAQVRDHTLRAQVVGVPQRAAAKRRETESEKSAHIAPARGSPPAFAHRAGR